MTGLPYHYVDGVRRPFNPTAAASALRCLLCGARVVLVGVFLATDERSRSAILRLRQHAVPSRSDPSLMYGLCETHTRDLDRTTAQVEEVIFAAAERIVAQ